MATILVVEDNDDIREVMVEALRDAGYEVLEAEHGQRALELLDVLQIPRCLALLDLMMPVMSGVELLTILEEQGRLEAMPVMVISAGGRASQVPQVTRFVQKPPNLDVLLSLVKDICAEHQG